MSPPPDILVTGHFKEQYGYSVYRTHGSGSWLITYTINGQGLYRQPGLQVWANPGDILLLQPNALHDYSVPSGGHWEFLWAHFQPRLDWLAWWHLPEIGQGLYKWHIHTPTTRERIHRAFFTLHADASTISALTLHKQHSQNNSEGSNFALQKELALNSLEEILLLTTRENTTTQPLMPDSRIQRVLEIISQNLQEPHTLASLAREVALSPSRLAHLFKATVGDSITNTLLHLRLNQSARLLESTTLPIKIVAEAVGFNSAFYFSRQFHYHFGISPRDYRTTMHKQGASQASDTTKK